MKRYLSARWTGFSMLGQRAFVCCRTSRGATHEKVKLHLTSSQQAAWGRVFQNHASEASQLGWFAW